MPNALAKKRNVLSPDRNVRNARLDLEMSHPGPNTLESAGRFRDYVGRVASGDVAREGLTQLADTLRNAGTNPEGLLDYFGAGGVTRKVSKALKGSDVDKLATGKPATINFVHNTESATDLFGKPMKDSPYGRWFEPSGKYMTHVDSPRVSQGSMEAGTVTFKNPIVMDNANLTWKESLSRKYGGKRGKKLSQAIIDDGYDGVITVDRGHTSEILDLTSFDPKKAKF